MTNNKETKPTKSTGTTPPRPKKLTLKQIQSEHKNLNKMSTFTYDEETNTKIKYYEQFSESKIDDLLLDLLSSITYTEENNLDYFEDNSRLILFIHFLIIKHFTNLKDEIPDDFPTQFTIMEQFYDKGIYRILMNDMFDGNEVLKVIERVEERIELAYKIEEATKKEMAKLDKLKNKDILNQPFNVLASPADVNK